MIFLELTISILPVFVVIMVGYALRKWEFLSDRFWQEMGKLCYYLLFPILLVDYLVRANSELFSYTTIGSIIALIFLCSGLVILLLHLFYYQNLYQFGSLFQGMLRINAFVGLSIAFTLHGDSAVSVATLLLGFVVPLLNISCVTVLAYCSSKGKENFSRLVVREILQNPFIIAIVIGIVANRMQWGFPPIIDDTMQLLSRLALPSALLTVGAGLRFHNLRINTGLILQNSAFKLLFMPTLTYLVCTLFAVDPMTQFALVLMMGLPVAVASYIFSRMMEVDHHLMASIISVQTVLSVFTLPLILGLFTSVPPI